MSNKYFKKKIEVRGHDRFDPRVGKKVTVGKYDRNQRYRNYDAISKTRARELFNQRSQRAKSLDLRSTSKKVFEEPNEYWEENINRTDVLGIDSKEEKSTKPKPKQIDSPKNWEDLSYDEKIDINDKVYDDDSVRNLENSIEKMKGTMKAFDKSLADAYQRDLPQEIKDKIKKKLKEQEEDVKKAEKTLEAKIGYLRKKFTKEYITKKYPQTKTKPKQKPKEYYDPIKERDAIAGVVQLRQEIYYAKREIEKEEKEGASLSRIALLNKRLREKQDKYKDAIRERNRVQKLPRKQKDEDYYSKNFGMNLEQIKETIKRGETLPGDVWKAIPNSLKSEYNHRQDEIKKIQEKFQKGEDISNDEIQKLPFIQQKPIIDLQWERRRARDKEEREARERSKKFDKEKLMKAKEKFFKKDEVTDVPEDVISNIKGMKAIMDIYRISMLTTPEMFEGTFIDKITKEGKVPIDLNPDKFILDTSGNKLIKHGKNYYQMDRYEHILKHMDKDTLEAYYGKGYEKDGGSPLIIRDKDYVFATAPRVSEPDPEGDYDIATGDFLDVRPIEDLVVSKAEYEKLLKKYTKDDLLYLADLDSTQNAHDKSQAIYWIFSKKRDDAEYKKDYNNLKADLKLKGKIRGDWTRLDDEDVSKSFGKGLMEQNRLGVITYTKDFERSKFHEIKGFKEVDLSKSDIAYDYNIRNKNNPSEEDLLIKIPDNNTNAYRFDLVNSALKEIRNPKILFKEDHPLVVKGEEKTFILAPRVCYEGEELELEVIPRKEYNRLMKLSKMDLARKVRHDPSLAKASGSKIGWVIEAYLHEIGESNE